MKYSKVNGHSNLIRDEETKAIINTNMTDYNNYIMQKRIKEKENQKLQNLEEDFVNMKEDLNEIKSLLRSLIDGPK
jgi:peroxiredoxin family protein